MRVTRHDNQPSELGIATSHPGLITSASLSCMASVKEQPRGNKQNRRREERTCITPFKSVASIGENGKSKVTLNKPRIGPFTQPLFGLRVENLVLVRKRIQHRHTKTGVGTRIYYIIPSAVEYIQYCKVVYGMRIRISSDPAFISMPTGNHPRLGVAVGSCLPPSNLLSSPPLLRILPIFFRQRQVNRPVVMRLASNDAESKRRRCQGQEDGPV